VFFFKNEKTRLIIKKQLFFAGSLFAGEINRELTNDKRTSFCLSQETAIEKVLCCLASRSSFLRLIK